jgi:hypothetical protein
MRLLHSDTGDDRSIYDPSDALQLIAAIGLAPQIFSPVFAYCRSVLVSGFFSGIHS